MNEDREVRVYGSYSNPEEIAEAIKKLRKEGYKKEEIKVYTSRTGTESKEDTSPSSTLNSKTVAEQSNTVIVSDQERRNETDKDDLSLWDQIKDFFTSDNYDYEKETQNPNYRKERDILYPHREEMSKGNRVIVLDKANENQTRVNI